jgi:hypothetical protein
MNNTQENIGRIIRNDAKGRIEMHPLLEKVEPVEMNNI